MKFKVHVLNTESNEQNAVYTQTATVLFCAQGPPPNQ